MMFLYSLNVFFVPLLSSLTTSVYSWIIVEVAYNVVFLVLTLVILGINNFKLFYRFLLYGLYTLSWIPITIQGIANKNKKEWSHTKHVRNVEICDL